MTTMMVFTSMGLPQPFAGLHIEKCDHKENHGEDQSQEILHVFGLLLPKAHGSASKRASIAAQIAIQSLCTYVSRSPRR